MPVFRGQTDQVLRIQLQSYLLEVLWGYAECAAGGVVPIEARTAYVADGSKIMIIVKDMNGGTVETIKGKVFSNFFRNQYKVKPNRTGGLFFEAEMKAHGLRLVSQAMKVLPPVGISGFKFEDENGNAITEVEDGQDVTMSADVKGPPDGTKALINLYALPEKYSKILVVSATTQVKSGKVSVIWRHQYPGDQEQKTVQADLSRTGEKYFAPQYFFEIECLGTKSQSPHVGYAGSLTLNFPNIRGKVTYVLPDGTEKTETIPDDGILKIKAPKVGKVKIKDIEEQKGVGSSNNLKANPKGDNVKEIILGIDELKEKKAAKKPVLEIVTGMEYRIVAQQKVELVETPDILFNLNSAVPCLDLEEILIGVLLTALEYSSENSDKAMVLFGHTDASGDYGHNYELSELRAKAVKALLDGDAHAWGAVVRARSRIIDYQIILKTLATDYGWSCDPGVPDDEYGPCTQAGVKNFQEQFNQKHSGSLVVDGIMGPKSWRAIFTVIRSITKDSYGKALPVPNYGYEGKGIYPCGESFPLAGPGYLSKEDRRVEAVFWDKDNPVPLMVHQDKNSAVTKEECPIYDVKKCVKTVLPWASMVKGGKILEAYFESETGEKIDLTQMNQPVFLVIKSSGMVGQKVDLDLSDAEYALEYNGKKVENDLLKDLKITSEKMKVELKTLIG